MDLPRNEMCLMAKIYLTENSTRQGITKAEAKRILGISERTCRTVLNNLVKKGYLNAVNSHIMFYYPVNDLEKKRAVLVQIGFDIS